MSGFDDIFGIEEENQPTRGEPVVEIEITDEFNSAYELIENGNDHVYITGDAGTGKSTFLKHFLKKTSKDVAVLAPTGLAAVNVGGQTIHSFFKFSPKPMTPDMMQLSTAEDKGKYKCVDTIVIDEISMTRADMIDCIDQFLRINRSNAFQPFGGAQIVMIGDLNQLPPIVATDLERSLLSSYKSRFFFDAKVWSDERVKMHKIKFTKNFRQKDQTFIDILNNLKYGRLTMHDLNALNERSGVSYKFEDGTVLLSTTNKIANEFNADKLSELEGTSKSYMATYEGKTSQFKSLVPDILTLKKGAQVMFINNDPMSQWKNGTTGIVVDMRTNSIKVETTDGYVYNVERNIWETHEHNHDKTKNEIKSESVGKVTQFPLKLAWAISIHKSQGQTYDRVIINFGNGIFDAGQSYVAISRCRTLEGIHFTNVFTKRNVKYDKKVLEFMATFDPEAKEALGRLYG